MLFNLYSFLFLVNLEHLCNIRSFSTMYFHFSSYFTSLCSFLHISWINLFFSEHLHISILLKLIYYFIKKRLVSSILYIDWWIITTFIQASLLKYCLMLIQKTNKYTYKLLSNSLNFFYNYNMIHFDDDLLSYCNFCYTWQVQIHVQVF